MKFQLHGWQPCEALQPWGGGGAYPDGEAIRQANRREVACLLESANEVEPAGIVMAPWGNPGVVINFAVFV